MKKHVFILFFAFVAAACGEHVPTGESAYTLRNSIASSPKAWNVHDWETSDDNYIPSYTNIGFYATVIGEDGNSYKVLPEMAASFPKDAKDSVTEHDRVRYGYQGIVGDGYVYDVELNPLATFEDGRAVVAKDYLESLERLLDPKFANFRADTVYASNFVIANAETYFKQGTTTTEPLYEAFLNSSDGSSADKDLLLDGVYILNLGKPGTYYSSIFPTQGTTGSFYTCLTSRPHKLSNEAELAAKRIVDAAQYFIFNYVSHEGKPGWENVDAPSLISDDEKLNYDIDIYDFDVNDVYVRSGFAARDEKDPSSGEIYRSEDLLRDLSTFVAAANNAHKTWSYLLPLFGHKQNTKSCTFGDVGLKAVDDYTLRFFLSRKISAKDLEFALSSNFLVDVEKYDRLTRMDGPNHKITDYATKTPENYTSYGPYKLVSYIRDNSIIMVRNENWYGYKDGKHNGYYQCDRIETSIISNHATARTKFLRGELDEFSLQNSDVADYGHSSFARYVPESYTQKISFNSDFAKLKARQDQTADKNDNKTLLASLKFREALSLSIDRREFATRGTAGSVAFTGLLNQQYLVDSDKNITYRSTDQAKSVYGKVYGLLGGENGGEMLNPSELDSGYTDNRSGYNPVYAKKLIKESIDEQAAIDGGYREGQTVVIQFLVSQSPDESETVRNCINYLSSAFNAVTKPNGVEVRIDAKKDEDYYTTAENGDYDMIYSIWGGAVNNPYGLMQVYCSYEFSKTCEYGFKRKQNSVSLEIAFSDGTTAKKTFHAWFDDIVKNLVEPSKEEGKEWTPSQQAEYDRIHTRRLDILAGLEAGVLSRFEAIPLVARSEASLTSPKIIYGADHFIPFVGFGGIRELKFRYDDQGWASFLAKHNYDLSDYYKS
ncbi:MAG: hypothetical protein K6B51_05270 [Bacilli bacterium]|nr:hypothetical protein [Bacilli bacterium]